MRKFAALVHAHDDDPVEFDLRLNGKAGYNTRFVITLTTCSSVIGVIIPPSILMMVRGGVMQNSVGALFFAVAIPGLLISAAPLATVCGCTRAYDYPVTLKPTFAILRSAFKGAALTILSPILVTGNLAGSVVASTKSAIIAAGYALFLGVSV